MGKITDAIGRRFPEYPEKDEAGKDIPLVNTGHLRPERVPQSPEVLAEEARRRLLGTEAGKNATGHSVEVVDATPDAFPLEVHHEAPTQDEQPSV